MAMRDKGRMKFIRSSGKPDLDPVFDKLLAILDQWAPLILVLLAIASILPRLDVGSLLDWDESIYAQVAREMIQSNDWINLQHGYKPYFEKPPLLMWSIAAGFKLFGVSEFWARFPSALSGILVVLTTYLIGRTIHGKRTGLLAGLILLSSFGFVYESRNGTTNMVLTLFVFLGIYAYVRLRDGLQKWWYLFFAASALAFMVKFWAGLILPGVVFIMVLRDGKIQEALRSKHFWLGLFLAALIVIPWHVLAFIQNGQAFVDAYIGRNLVQRALTPLEGHYGTTIYYLDVMRKYFSPWLFLVPFALFVAIKEIVDGQRKSDILVLLSLSVLGLYTFFVNTKLGIYILPVFPALAILTAYLFVLAASRSNSDCFLYLVSGGLVMMLTAQNKILILFLLVGLVLVLLRRIHILSMEQMIPVTTTLIFVGFAIVGTVSYVQGNNRILTGAIYEIPDSPVSQIATLAGRANPTTNDPLIGFNPQDQNRLPDSAVEGPAATFYSNRPVLVAKTWEELMELMSERGSGEILIAENYLDSLPADFNVTVLETIHPLVYARFSQ